MIRAALALAVLGLGACSRRQPAASSDSAFAVMQQRDDRTDTAGVRAIRDHFRAVHEFLAFQGGAHRAGGQHLPGMHMP